MKYKKQTFDMDKFLELPTPVTHHVIDDKNLYIAVNVPTWVVLNDIDALILDCFINKMTIRNTIKKVSESENMNWDEAFTRVKKLISLLYAKDFFNKSYASNDHEVKRVRNIQFHLTNKCNLRCIHCYMDSGITRYEEVSVEKWKEVIDRAAARYGEIFLSLTGGEPLLYKGYLEILRFAKESKGASTGMISNGMLLDENKIKELEKYLDNIQISLDGATAAVNDRIRGKGVFNRVTQSLRMLGNSKIRVGLNIVVMKSNAKDIEENLYSYIKNELNDMEIDLDLSSFVSEGRGRDLSENVKPMDFASTLSYTAEHFVEEDSWMPTPSYPRRSCGYGNTIDVYPNGDVSPCLTPRFIRGNLFKDGIDNVLDWIDAEREQSMVDALPECKTCDLRYICGGRCHLGTLREGNGISQVDCSEDYKRRMRNNLIKQFEVTTKW